MPEVIVIPNLIDMILVLSATFIMFLILRKLLYKPVSAMLEKRKENIRSNIESAKKENEEAMALKLDYENRILEAKEEAQKIIESGRTRGEEVRKDIIAEARKEAEDIKQRGMREAQQEKERALIDVKNEAGDMAILIASKILERNVDISSQEDLIDKFLNEMGNSTWQN